MDDRRPILDARKPAAGPASDPPKPAPARTSPPVGTARPERPLTALEANPRRPASKFGAAVDGWDAYNSWLDRVRQPVPPPSRQAVISKALYSVSSYKNWADKARGAFEPAVPVVGKTK